MKKKLEEFLQAWKVNTAIQIPKFTEKKIKEIIDKIYEPQYGARPIERYIQEHIEPEIINSILQ